MCELQTYPRDPYTLTELSQWKNVRGHGDAQRNSINEIHDRTQLCLNQCVAHESSIPVLPGWCGVVNQIRSSRKAVIIHSKQFPTHVSQRFSHEICGRRQKKTHPHTANMTTPSNTHYPHPQRPRNQNESFARGDTVVVLWYCLNNTWHHDRGKDQIHFRPVRVGSCGVSSSSDCWRVVTGLPVRVNLPLNKCQFTLAAA